MLSRNIVFTGKDQLETGYTGYLGQEFLPLGDPIAALKQAFDLCNIAL